jgi:protein-L-isoaspartate(D-aspartate) O-methyltransferase
MSKPLIHLDDSMQRMRRTGLVERELRGRGIRDDRVLDVMAAIPRHLFVPPDQVEHAYEDRALSIGFGQTISQPYMLALMLQAVEFSGTERVLDVGTGSGYQAALLSALAREVVSIEIVPELAASARSRLAELGFRNIEVIVGNGRVGYHQNAPYDVIIVAAATPELPTSLIEQLDDDGVLLVPVGSEQAQELLLVHRLGRRLTTRKVVDCAFVPFVQQSG